MGLLTAIGDRLREERIRIFKTVTAMADSLDINRKSIENYEAGRTPINVALLIVYEANGFDIGYIVTGKRSNGDLGFGDAELLRVFGLLSHREREAVMQFLYTLTGETVLLRDIGPVSNVRSLHENKPAFTSKPEDKTHE